MNWFTKLFKSKSVAQSEIRFFEACDSFIKGEKIWKESVLSKTPLELRKSKTKEALNFFDIAIEKGYDKSEVFSLRASCLNNLGFYIEAIEDYNAAIQKNPRKGIASNYHMRSLIKDTIFDFEGSLADIKEAIRLSRLDNEDNKYWNNYAKSTGFNSATEFYELSLSDIERRRNYTNY